MFAWILSQIDIFMYMFTGLMGTSTPIYFVTLYSKFFMELAFVVLCLGIFLDEASPKKTTNATN